MLTAYSNEEYLIDLINLNINHFILKPLNLKKLLEALDIKYVAQNVESSRRNDNLSFTHHREVASLPRLSEWIRQL